MTRKSLQRELGLNAATKPLASASAPAVAVAAFVVGTPGCSPSPSSPTRARRDDALRRDEAGRVGATPTSAPSANVERTRSSRRGSRRHLGARSPRAHRGESDRARDPGVRPAVHRRLVEVEHLMSELERNARRAQVALGVPGRGASDEARHGFAVSATRTRATQGPRALETCGRTHSSINCRSVRPCGPSTLDSTPRSST